MLARLLFLFTALVALPVVVAAQVAAVPHHHSLSLEAQSVANGGTSKVTGGGSARVEQVSLVSGGAAQSQVAHVHEEHDTVQQTNVQVNIRNLGQTADTIKLEWFFVAAPVGGKPGQARDFIFDHGAQDVNVASNSTETRTVASKEARSVLKRSATTLQDSGISFVGGGNSRGSSKQSGIIMRGWFVRLTDNGQVVATHGSSQAYEDLAKDEARLKELQAQPAKQR